MSGIYSGPLSVAFGDAGHDARWIGEWIHQSLDYLRKSGMRMAGWEEDPERPFFAESIPDEAYSAFIITAASLFFRMPLLSRIAAGSRHSSHPLVLKLAEGDGYSWGKAAMARFIIPSPDSFVYIVQLPGENGPCHAASTAAFSDALSHIRSLLWPEADDISVIGWSSAGGVRRPDRDGEYPCGDLARYAFSVLFRALRFSSASGTPAAVLKSLPAFL